MTHLHEAEEVHALVLFTDSSQSSITMVEDAITRDARSPRLLAISHG
jgi:hypothetical protein